jgi:TM2 domain-containing membrane protein YozV
MEGTSLGLSANAPLAPSPPQATSPAMAFVISLLLPGGGQLYCGKGGRGTITLALFFSALAVILGTKPQGEAALWWGVALRTALVLYTFAFLDAYFTAAEINSGIEQEVDVSNPRVATTLNLLTNGFGYFYLGERSKGIAVFVCMGLANTAVRQRGGERGNPTLLAFEVIALFIAVDAYRIARQQLRESAPEAVIKPNVSALPALVPVTLAGLFALNYCLLVMLGIAMPNYKVIDHSQARIEEQDKATLFSNPKYGIRMRIPAGWKVDVSNPKLIVTAEKASGACEVQLLVAAESPFATVNGETDALREAILKSNSNFSLAGIGERPLGNLAGQQVMFLANVHGVEVFQRYIVAKRRLSGYVLVETMASNFREQCQPEVEAIRNSVMIGP